jgi:hypothetical protein
MHHLEWLEPRVAMLYPNKNDHRLELGQPPSIPGIAFFHRSGILYYKKEIKFTGNRYFPLYI